MTTDPRTATESEFAALLERHRRQLHVHCYRMLGSFEDAEDMVQETFLRAWRKRASFEGRSSFRGWLYSIATNACLDQLKRRPRKPVGGEVLWLQPYPDELLDTVPSDEDEPDATVVDRETIELAFLVAVQHLPPRQRAVLIVRDVLGWSAKETADLLETSVASANSALQRARATMKQHLPERRLEWQADATEQEKALVARYIEATELFDAGAFADMMREDAVFTMPPEPGIWRGRENIINGWIEGGFGSESFGRFRCVPTRANRQPAVANYVRKPDSDTYTLFAVDVLRVEDGQVADIITFHGPALATFDLPETLDPAVA